MKSKTNKHSTGKALKRDEPKYQYFFLAGIILLVAFIYSNSLMNELLNFDDIEYFTKYPEILKLSWNNVVKYFSGYYVIMYQPLPVLSFAVNYHFTGTDAFPLHIVNLLFHMANILLVYWFIKQLSNKTKIALVVALLFAIHPMNVEAISWISARSSGMYTFFYLLSLVIYIKYLKSDNKYKYLVYSCLSFLLSLLSKSQAVTLPLVLLLLDYFYGRKLTFKPIIEKLPFFILSILFGIITLMDKNTISNVTSGVLVSYSASDIFFMTCYSLFFYIYKLFIPFNLCGIHTYPLNPVEYLPFIYYFAPLFLGSIIYVIYKFRKNKYLIFGFLLFFVTIIINIQIIPSRLTIVAERYAYFPYLGLFFIIGYLYSRVAESNIQSHKKYKLLFHLVLFLYCIFFSYAVWERNKIWKNDVTFLSDIIEKNDPVPYLSRVYANRGLYYSRNDMVNEAIYDYSKAIELNPEDAMLYLNRGCEYIKLNKLQNALDDLTKAEMYNPKIALTYSNRAFVRFSLKDFEGTLTDCNTCIKIDPTIPEAYNIRSAIEFMNKDYVQCEKDLNKAIELKPGFAEAYKNRGILFMRKNEPEQACKDWQQSIFLGNQEAASLFKKYCSKTNDKNSY